jgi:hypothetical protein
MSLLANIDHLAIAAGIEAVVVDTGPREYRGDQSWHPVLDGALDLFHRTDEKSIRLVVGKHTIVVQKENEETVAVVLPTGHAIAKSLRRMIRRMARKNRGPLPKAKQELVHGAKPVVSPPAAPGLSQPSVPSQGQSTPPSGAQHSVPPVAKPSEEAKGTPASSQQQPSGTPAPTDRGGFRGY